MSLPHIELLYSFSGLFVGFLVGLTGVGGGSLMTPILVLLFKVHPATAVGTDLLYAAATKATGTLVHGLKGSVDWQVTTRLAAGSVPAATVTLILLHRYGMDTPGASRLIQIVLGAALLITSVALVFRPQLAKLGAGRQSSLTQGRTLGLTVLTGAVLGVLVSLCCCCCIRACPLRESSARTSRMPCRSRCSPVPDTGCSARSTGRCCCRCW
jgi:uncharacterized membrane protein YfcA